MSSRIAFKPRSFFLKSQLPVFQHAKPIQETSHSSTKESSDLKVYAEKMIKEQKMSSQKLNQLSTSLQQMTRTIRIFLLNIEKQQTMIQSLTTLKTENSRLKEMISSKTGQVEEMTHQLQSVSDAKKSLHDLLTSLFTRITMIQRIGEAIDHIIHSNQSKATEIQEQEDQLCKSLEQVRSSIHTHTQSLHKLEKEYPHLMETLSTLSQKIEAETNETSTLHLNSSIAISKNNLIEHTLQIKSIHQTIEEFSDRNKHLLLNLQQREKDVLKEEQKAHALLDELKEVEKDKEGRQRKKVVDHTLQEIQDNQQMIQQLNSKLQELKAQEEQLNQRIQAQQQEIVSLTNQRSEWEAQCAHRKRMKEEISRLEASIQSEEECYSKEKEQVLSDAFIQDLQEKVKKEQAEVEQNLQRVNELKRELQIEDVSEQTVARELERVTQLRMQTERRENSRQAIENYNKQILQFEKDIQAVEKEMEALKQIDEHELKITPNEELTQLETTIQQLKDEHMQSLKKIETKYNSIIKSKTEEYLRQKQQLLQERASLQTEAGSKEKEIKLTTITPRKKKTFTPVRKSQKTSSKQKASLQSLSRKSNMQFQPIKTTSGDWFKDDFF